MANANTATETATVTVTAEELLFDDDAIAALELVSAGVPVELAMKAARDGVLYGDEGLAAVLAITAAAEAEAE